ncbi:MAG: hypothetical protein GXP26_14155 [Planctomycetes bacterium]|nr:hypothetical protein [Planctomycetota bacterium]
MHFGLYLVKHGVITSAQFTEALECQLLSRPQLGALAIEQGKLSVKEIFRILQAQADDPKKLFGELAVKAGMISEDELESLLYRQSTCTLPMVKIIVELGFVTADVAQECLVEYRSETSTVEESLGALIA